MKGIILLLILSVCMNGCGKVYSGEMDVLGSQTISFGNYYMEDLTVIVDVEKVDDYERCAREVIEHCLLNDFASTDFCYDECGFPNSVKATVFLSKKDVENWKPLFDMSYTTNSYEDNIKDNPENYTLQVDVF